MPLRGKIFESLITVVNGSAVQRDGEEILVTAGAIYIRTRLRTIFINCIFNSKLFENLGSDGFVEN